MRAAILYSGLPRMWDGSVQTHRAIFGDASVDVFCHFWDTVDAAEKARLNDALRPAACVWDPLPDFSVVNHYGGLLRDNINIPARMVSQYVSWQRVGTLFAPYAPIYGAAARMRTDLRFHAPFSLDLAAIAGEPGEAVAFAWPEAPDMVFDGFAAGTPGFVLHYHALLSRLWDYAADTVFNAEVMVTKHVTAYPRRIAVKLLGSRPFFVMRPHMAGWPLERCLAEGIGVAKWRDPEIRGAHVEYHRARLGEAGEAHVDRFAESQFRAGRLGQG
jgi:hypothetical protein